MSWIHHDKDLTKRAPRSIKGVANRLLVVEELVIAWLAMGLTIREIGRNLKLTDKGAEYHWREIRKRYKFRCYQDACRYAMVHNLIPFKV